MQRQDSSTLSSQVCGQQEPGQPQRVRELTTEGAQEPSQPQRARELTTEGAQEPSQPQQA